MVDNPKDQPLQQLSSEPQYPGVPKIQKKKIGKNNTNDIPDKIKANLHKKVIMLIFC